MCSFTAKFQQRNMESLMSRPSMSSQLSYRRFVVVPCCLFFIIHWHAASACVLMHPPHIRLMKPCDSEFKLNYWSKVGVTDGTWMRKDKSLSSHIYRHVFVVISKFSILFAATIVNVFPFCGAQVWLFAAISAARCRENVDACGEDTHALCTDYCCPASSIRRPTYIDRFHASHSADSPQTVRPT